MGVNLSGWCWQVLQVLEGRGEVLHKLLHLRVCGWMRVAVWRCEGLCVNMYEGKVNMLCVPVHGMYVSVYESLCVSVSVCEYVSEYRSEFVWCVREYGT